MNIKLIRKKSELLEQIYQECAQLQQLQPDFDKDFFDEATARSYLNFIMQMKNGQLGIINDTKRGGEK